MYNEDMLKKQLKVSTDTVLKISCNYHHYVCLILLFLSKA